MLIKHILTIFWFAQHLNSGQNIQQIPDSNKSEFHISDLRIRYSDSYCMWVKKKCKNDSYLSTNFSMLSLIFNDTQNGPSFISSIQENKEREREREIEREREREREREKKKERLTQTDLQ